MRKEKVMPLAWLLAVALLCLLYHVRETAREQGREDERKKKKAAGGWPK
jgi:predicted RNA polymerase sigma factor